jgi:hypothetical protein
VTLHRKKLRRKHANLLVGPKELFKRGSCHHRNIQKSWGANRSFSTGLGHDAGSQTASREPVRTARAFRSH